MNQQDAHQQQSADENPVHRTKATVISNSALNICKKNIYVFSTSLFVCQGINCLPLHTDVKQQKIYIVASFPAHRLGEHTFSKDPAPKGIIISSFPINLERCAFFVRE